MKYDLSNHIDKEKAIVRFKHLLDKGCNIELTEVKKLRTLSQNKYLHICITMFAIEFGLTVDESKTHLKRNCHFMRYEKGDETYLKRTRGMDTKELTDFIEWIIDHAGKQGLLILSSEDYLANQFNIDKEISKFNKYL